MQASTNGIRMPLGVGRLGFFIPRRPLSSSSKALREDLGIQKREFRPEPAIATHLFDNVKVTAKVLNGTVFNITVDIKAFISYNRLILEVFTSVPPDPVSIVHCRHWVTSSQGDSAASANSAVPAGTSAPQPYTLRSPLTLHSPNFVSPDACLKSDCRSRQ